MTTFNRKWKQLKIYRIEEQDPDGRWVEICPRQPTLEAAAVKRYKYAKRKKLDVESLRIVEQDV